MLPVDVAIITYIFHMQRYQLLIISLERLACKNYTQENTLPDFQQSFYSCNKVILLFFSQKL